MGGAWRRLASKHPNKKQKSEQLNSKASKISKKAPEKANSTPEPQEASRKPTASIQLVRQLIR